MFKKIIIYCASGLLAGALWAVAQDAQPGMMGSSSSNTKRQATTAVDSEAKGAEQASAQASDRDARRERLQRLREARAQEGRPSGPAGFPGFGGERGERGDRPGMGGFGSRPNRGGDRGSRGDRPGRGEGFGAGFPGAPGGSGMAPQETTPQPQPAAENEAQPSGEEKDAGEMEKIEPEDDTKNPLYGNPYRVIVKRNLFQLQAVAALGEVITNVVPIVLNTNNLKFLGVTTVAGEVKAHFQIAKPGEQPPYEYISLRPGEAASGLECISVDLREPSAEVKADNKKLKVNFETHGVKSAGGAVRAGQQQPGQNNQPGGRPGQPGQPGQNNQFNRGPGQGGPQGAPGQQNNNNQQQGGFNMPAVNNQNNNGWRGGMPMTREAQNFQNRRGGGNMPPMPPMPGVNNNSGGNSGPMMPGAPGMGGR